MAKAAPEHAEPELSVVVASFSGEEALDRCLDSLARQRTAPPSPAVATEVVVASALRATAVEPLRHRHPPVRFVAAPAGTEVFALRSLGVRSARGRWVALTEDHATASPGWLAAIAGALREGRRAVGGPVLPRRNGSAYHLALDLCEYGYYLPPIPTGPATALSGINVAYHRGLLDEHAGVWTSALRENELHDALHDAGHRLWAVPEAVMTSHLGMPLGEAAGHLFDGGRHFGRYRKSRASALRRRLLPLAAPAVPAVLLARLLRRVATRQPRLLLRLVPALPAVTTLLAAWSAGEAAGYLRSVDREPATAEARR